MNVVYMGTPDFAVNTLEEIIKAGHTVKAVITQPDKPKGRGKAMQYTPVKEKALEHNIEVYQPIKVREEEFVNLLKDINPDVIVVVAFGQILPESILNIPKYGCINVHASLLPKYRGAAPIQWAVIDGEKTSGVTTMYMAKGLDTGDMIDKVEITLDDKETGGSLHDILADAGAKLLVTTLEKLENNTATRTVQDDEDSCYAKMLDKGMGLIDFNKSAVEIERLIRGLNPWPSAYTKFNDKTLKVYEAEVIDETQGEVGSVWAVDKKSFTVACGEGSLRIKNLQLEGKKRMDTSAFLLGYKVEIGNQLG